MVCKMPHFAKIENNVVVDVLVITQEEIDTCVFGPPQSFIQTSYNTRGGVHYGPDGKPDGGVALRKNFSGIGFTYDSVLDAFIPQQTYSSWVLNTETCLWEPPIPVPNDGNTYNWDESTKSWVLFTGA